MRWLLVVLVACQQGAPAPAVQTKESWGAPPPMPTVPTPPLDVPPPTDPIVAVGRNLTRACVVRASGVVDCWGDVDGSGPPIPNARPRRLAFKDVVGISPQARCLLHRDGHASCFDAGGYARSQFDNLAIVGDNECHVAKGGTLTCEGKVHGAIAIASAGWRTCALTATGDVWCGEYDAFKRVPELAHARAIAMRTVDGSVVVCAASDDVHCWDVEREKPADVFTSFHAPNATQLTFDAPRGIESEAGDPEPELTALVGDHLVSTAGATLDHVNRLSTQCAVRESGTLACWGLNAVGVLGQPTTIGSLASPVAPVPGLSNVISISSNLAQTWAVLRDHTIVRWGFESPSEGTRLPARYTFDPPFASEPWAQVAATWPGELCARSTLGKVVCRRFVHGTEFVKPLDVTDAIDIQFNSGGSLVIERANGTVVVAEANEMYDHTTPLPAEHIAEITGNDSFRLWEADHVDCDKRRMFDHVQQFVVGNDFVCALSAGSMRCKRASAFTDLTNVGLSGVSEIHAAPDHVCALASGAITCWSIGKTITATTVIPRNAMSFVLGPGYDDLWHDNHSATDGTLDAGFSGCAIMLDHTVQCWGANFHGELFDTSFVGTKQPIGIRLP